MDVSNSVIGGAIANFIFVSLYAVGAYLKNRLGKSDCHIDCGWLTCDTSLKELEKLDNKLEKTQSTQRNMLEEIIIHIKDKQNGEASLTPLVMPPLLRTPVKV